MDKIDVSVIIPTYKPQDYLWVCLDSLADQTFDKRRYEIIIVLNGCNEPYQSKIKAYISLKPSCQFTFVQTDKGGVSNARNIGIENARGEYIAFVDDDDYVSSLYLEELYKMASTDTISLAYPFAFNDGNEKIQLKNRITDEYNRKYTSEKLEFQKARRFFSGPCMKLIHRSIVGDRRFDKRLKNGEDTLFMFQVSDRIMYVSFTSVEAIYYRRFRINSATTTKRSAPQKIRDNMIGLSAYFSIYLSNVKGYKLGFFLTRVFGAIRGMVV